MRVLLALLCLAALAGCRPIRATTAPADDARTFHVTSGGLDRTFLVHVGAGDHRSMPIVLALHGNTGTASGMRSLTHFDQVADADGFIVAYPDGYRRSWADGRGASAADRAGVDDVAFLGTVIDTVVAGYPAADAHRVYVTGISNGAMMAHRLGCALAGRISAIAPDAGGMPEAVAASCHPARPVAVLDIQGTEDPLVPYAGGEVTVPVTGAERGPLLSATGTATKWAALDGCGAEPVDGSVPDQARDGTSTATRTWCDQVWLYTVTGGGHTWPGGVQYLPAAVIGRTARDFDASAVIGAFFLRH